MSRASRRLLTTLRRRGGGGFSGVTDGLIHEYRFDTGSGTDVIDVVGGANIPFGAGAAAPAWHAYGLSFDGGDHCQHTTAPVVAAQPITHVCVVNPTSDTGANAIFFDSGDAGARNLFYWSGTGDRLSSYAGTGIYYGNSSASVGWKIYTMVFNGASSTCYDNTTLKTGIPDEDVGAHALTGLTFGKTHLLASPVVGYYGYHLIYNKALSADEIATNAVALTAIMDARGVTIP